MQTLTVAKRKLPRWIPRAERCRITALPGKYVLDKIHTPLPLIAELTPETNPCTSCVEIVLGKASNECSPKTTNKWQQQNFRVPLEDWLTNDRLTA